MRDTAYLEFLLPDGTSLAVRSLGENAGTIAVEGRRVFILFTDNTLFEDAPDFYANFRVEGVQLRGFALEHPDAQTRAERLSPEVAGTQFAHFLAENVLPRLSSRHLNGADEICVLCGCGLGALFAFHCARVIPGLFSHFACLSTSFEDLSQSPPLRAGELIALEDMATPPTATRMYFDYGDTGLDECYEPYHQELAAILREKGWTDEREFAVRQIRGGTHVPSSWRARLGAALNFLLS